MTEITGPAAVDTGHGGDATRFGAWGLGLGAWGLEVRCPVVGVGTGRWGKLFISEFILLCYHTMSGGPREVKRA